MQASQSVDYCLGMLYMSEHQQAFLCDMAQWIRHISKILHAKGPGYEPRLLSMTCCWCLTLRNSCPHSYEQPNSNPRGLQYGYGLGKASEDLRNKQPGKADYGNYTEGGSGYRRTKYEGWEKGVHNEGITTIRVENWIGWFAGALIFSGALILE